jgi:octaprenyl-diphosphate synthase
MQPQAFYRAVADDFSAVDGIIKQQLTSKVPLVSKIGDYIRRRAANACVLY